MNIAVIPARGGSKRIPRKNIKDFCGKPMLVWSIEAARESNCFDRIIVSTDDEEISEVAQAHGAEAPFIRPPELSGDHIGTQPVIAHAIDWVDQNLSAVKFACCLYSTAPFVAPDDIRASLAMLEEHHCDYVLPVASFAFPVQRALRVGGEGMLRMMSSQFFATRSQDLECAYHDAGQFCWGTASAWAEGRPVFETATLPFVLPRYRVQDIDTNEDWVRAEHMFKTLMTAL